MFWIEEEEFLHNTFVSQAHRNKTEETIDIVGSFYGTMYVSPYYLFLRKDNVPSFHSNPLTVEIGVVVWREFCLACMPSNDVFTTIT